MPAGIFTPRRVPDIQARTKRIEDYLERLSADVATLVQPRSAAKNVGVGAAAGGGGSGSGPSGVLAGDVVGPESSNLVELLQGVTLTLTSPLTGEVLTFNGTAIVNSNTIQGNLTIAGVTTTEGFATAVAAKSGPYTLLYTDHTIYADTSGGGFTLTLPTAVGHAGHEFEIKKVSADFNTLLVAFTAGQTADGTAPITIIMPETSLGFRSDNADWNLF